MKAKQEAKELYDKFFWKFYAHTGKTRIDLSKKCALICVDRLIQEWNDWERNEHGGKPEGIYNQDYWQEVKQEISLENEIYNGNKEL